MHKSVLCNKFQLLDTQDTITSLQDTQIKKNKAQPNKATHNQKTANVKNYSNLKKKKIYFFYSKNTKIPIS